MTANKTIKRDLEGFLFRSDEDAFSGVSKEICGVSVFSIFESFSIDGDWVGATLFFIGEAVSSPHAEQNFALSGNFVPHFLQNTIFHPFIFCELNSEMSYRKVST